jgi:uncharacterized protein with HEPN domain
MATEPSLSREDRSRFEHMRKASRDAMNVLENRDVEALRADMIRTRALVNCFTEIGEAAARVTDEARRIASEVPWRQIVGMRHNLVHVYWGIDLRELVKTVRSDLPAFIAALDRVLGTQEMEPRAGRRPRSAKRKPKSG